jgi:uncharacterized protein (DUF2062 family)
MASFLQRRLITPLVAILREGTAPQKLACSVACGVVCGLFPVMGTTTLLAGAAALTFGLNLPTIQLVNYLIYPLQLALIVPFIRAGEFMLGAQGTRLSLLEMIAVFRHNHWQGLHVLWLLALQGIVAWLFLAPFLFAAVYSIALPPIRGMARAIAASREAGVVIP